MLYTVVGVEKDADIAMIKKGYRKQCLLHHPDKNKGKETEIFQEIKNAYDTLCGPSREIYDKWGLEGLQLMQNVKPQELLYLESLRRMTEYFLVLYNHVYALLLSLRR